MAHGGDRDIADVPLITEYGFDESVTQFEGLGERYRTVPSVITEEKEGTVHYIDSILGIDLLPLFVAIAGIAYNEDWIDRVDVSTAITGKISVKRPKLTILDPPAWQARLIQ